MNKYHAPLCEFLVTYACGVLYGVQRDGVLIRQLENVVKIAKKKENKKQRRADKKTNGQTNTKKMKLNEIRKR